MAGRDNLLAGIVPPSGDGVLRVLFLRPGADGDSRDLFVAAVDPAGRQSETLLLSDLNAQETLGCVAPCTRIDPTGHIWLYPKSGGLVRVDPITGDRLKWDGLSNQQLSPSGQRFAISTPTTTITTTTLYEPDGETRVFAGASSSKFAGEDFYYETPDAALMHVPPSGAPEQVTTGLVTSQPPLQMHDPFFAFPTPDGPLLVLNRPTSDPNGVQSSIRDPVTGQETILPFRDLAAATASPDGRWLLVTESSGVVGSTDQFSLVDCRSGATEALDVPFATGAPDWRPGHDELWTTVGTLDAPSVWIAAPGAPAITVPGVAFAGFPAGGASWFSVPDVYASSPMYQIGMADDPTGPTFPVNPPGTSFDESKVSTLADGRVLTASYVNERERSDITAIDPGTGDSRVLAERGRLAAVGQTRFIGMFDFAEGRGDLTSVDVGTGEKTVLAAEFTVSAFAEPQGADPVAPGTWVAYQFQARTASPYDGIWAVAVP